MVWGARLHVPAAAVKADIRLTIMVTHSCKVMGRQYMESVTKQSSTALSINCVNSVSFGSSHKPVD